LFNNQSLYVQDQLLKYAPTMIIGDDGGFTNYILWHANKLNIVIIFNLIFLFYLFLQ